MRVIISGGGTAGHINPGVAIAKKILEKMPDSVIKFVGTEKGLESQIVPNEGFEIDFIRVAGFRRKISFDTVKTFKLMFDGYSDAKKIINEFKPDVVIGTGGYVCGPVLFAAAMKKIPTLIHEQNAFAGVTNKLLSKKVDCVCVSFEESKTQFSKKAKIVYTGNPVRPEIGKANRTEARKKLKVNDNQNLVVVMGGSRGAEKINDAMVDLINKLHKAGSYKLIWATGSVHYDGIKKRLRSNLPEDIEVVDYLNDMGSVYAAADLLVCRAGAITVTEIAITGVPSILIPSPYVTANHQEYNARVLTDKGGAQLLLEKDLNADVLSNQINLLLTNAIKRQEMGKKAQKLIISNASERIYFEIENMLQKLTR